MTPGTVERLESAMHLCQQGRTGEAESLCREILASEPRHPEALHLLGLMVLQSGDLRAGVDLVRRSVKANPRQPAAYCNLGVALLRLQRPLEALASFEKALAGAPSSIDVLCNLGTCQLRLGRAQQALASFERALQLRPDHAEALEGRGNALQALERHEEAFASFDRALLHRAGESQTHNNRAIALKALNRCEEALASLKRALELRPDNTEALANRASVLQALRRPAEALESCQRALELKPDYVEALSIRCEALRSLQRHEEAVRSYAELLAIAPQHDYAPGAMLHSQLNSCDWTDYAARVERIVKAVQRGRRVDCPPSFLAISGSPAAQLECARIFAAHRYPPAPVRQWGGQRYRHDRIRLAYLSGDFHEHATAHLTAELFELHDRRQFELTAVSFGPEDGSDMRQRLRRAFERFVDVRALGDAAVAAWLRQSEIDIAIDLKGFTNGCRTGILSHRPAPIQVSYLGYPGTLGAAYVDYLIADRHVLPAAHRDFYTEKVVYLPDCYQVNGSRCETPAAAPQRADAGLPPHGVVFCCFHQHYKITPVMFDIWLRLLASVDDSVLWLLEGGPAVARNLRAAGARRGIESGRLVFAPLVPHAQHLARLQLADLFLDTLPVNAHTTASDALRMGLPVLSCPGEAFVGRVAGSLLHAVGLPELAVGTLADYVQRARELATSPALLLEIRTRLARNLSTHPLFDTDRFRRHLESAYLTMMERHGRGLAPAGFSVEPLAAVGGSGAEASELVRREAG